MHHLAVLMRLFSPAAGGGSSPHLHSPLSGCSHLSAGKEGFSPSQPGGYSCSWPARALLPHGCRMAIASLSGQEPGRSLWAEPAFVYAAGFGERAGKQCCVCDLDTRKVMLTAYVSAF